MKKVLLITCVAALLLGTVSVAFASATDWTLLMRAGTTTNAAQSSIAQFGTKTGAGNGQETTGDVWTSFNASNAAVGSYQPTWANDPPIWTTDKRAPITSGKQEWNILMWLGTGYGGTDVKLYWYGTSSQDIPTQLGGMNATYTIDVLRDPTGKYTGQKFVIDAANDTSTSSNPFGSMTWSGSDIATLKMANSLAKDNAVQLRFTAAVPEPGSMLALGSGLIGMAGFAIRRRRA